MMENPMASFLLIGLAKDKDGNPHLAVISDCTKRDDYINAIKSIQDNPESGVSEVLCVSGSILPAKVEGTKIKALTISRVEYPVDDATAQYITGPVYIKGDNNA